MDSECFFNQECCYDEDIKKRRCCHKEDDDDDADDYLLIALGLVVGVGIMFVMSIVTAACKCAKKNRYSIC